MSEATAQLVLEALRKGKTLTSICSGRLNNCYTPGEKITDHSLYRNYCAAHPDFSQEAQALLAENTRAATARKGARLRNRTHCSTGIHFLASAAINSAAVALGGLIGTFLGRSLVTPVADPKDHEARSLTVVNASLS